MLHLAIEAATDHTDTWIQSVIGPAVIIVVGWVLNVFQKRRSKKLEDKLTTQVADVKTQVGATKKEITNEHPTHLRDDLDDRFDNLDSKFELVLQKQDLQDAKLDQLKTQQTRHGQVLTRQGNVIVAVRKDVAALFGDSADHQRDITELQDTLERTIPKNQLPEIEP